MEIFEGAKGCTLELPRAATHTCTQATQIELIFPIATRGVRIERALAGCSPPGLMNALTAALL